MSLLKAIATERVDEAGFKDLVNKMRGKPAAEQPAENPTPDTHKTSGDDTDTAMKRIASQLSDSGDSVKVAVDIDRAGLVNRYLQKGGDLAAASDEQLFPEEKIDHLQGEFKAARNRHDPKDWPESPADRLMLFSVPKNVVQNFLRFTGATDEDKANRRKALANVIAHKYYQMTLKSREAYKLIDQIEAAAQQKGEEPMSFDILEELFNPYVIENHPAGILKAARNEWDARQAQQKAAPGQAKDAELDAQEADAHREQRAREIEKTRNGGNESESFESAVLNQYLSNMDQSPEDIAAIMTKHFDKVKDVNMVQKMVQQLGEKYPKTNLKDVAISFKKPEDNTGQPQEQ